MDPSKLTKDKLRSELIAHSVALPSPKAKKEEYVHLYREHVLPSQVGDFSSDEESTFAKPKAKPKKPYSSSSKPQLESFEMDLDISSLTDKELAQMLRDIGENPGPILKSTRRVHEKKLHRLLTEKPQTNGDPQNEYSDEEEEEEEEEEVEEEEEEEEEEPEPEPVIPIRANRRVIEAETRDVRKRVGRDAFDAPVVTTRTDSARFRPRPEVPCPPRTYDPVRSSYTPHDDTPYTPSPPHPTSSPLITQERPVAKATKRKRSSLSICAQVAIFVAVAVFIWLVIQNMDPASKGLPKLSV